MYDFPASPTENQQFIPPVGGQTYVYKSPRWLVKGIPPVGGGGSGGGIEEAPTDGQQYAREDANWTVVEPGISDWADITGKPTTFPPELPIAQTGVTNLVSDLLLKAPLVSPAFTGVPVAPTPATGTNTTQIATAAFVKAQGYLTGAPIDGFTYGRQSGNWVAVVDQVSYTATLNDLWAADSALEGSVAALTGRVTSLETAGYISDAPNNGQQYARQNAGWAVVSVAAPAWTDITGKPSTFPPSTHSHPQSEVTNLVTDLAAKAPLASPALTGNPTAPTPTAGDNDTSVATTAFVVAAITAALSAFAGGAYVSDTAPVSPTNGALWWDSSTGGLYIYYNDGTSSQWVQVNGVSA